MSDLARVQLLNVLPGTIVCHEGEWGVVKGHSGSRRKGWRIVDFWFDGLRYVPDIAEVEVVPGARPLLYDQHSVRV